MLSHKKSRNGTNGMNSGDGLRNEAGERVVGLADQAGKLPVMVSCGQQQRAAIAWPSAAFE